MAETITARLGLHRWSDSVTDTFGRAELDADHAAIDNLAAVDVQGLLAARPAAGVRGRWYFATDAVKRLYREDGSLWREVALIGDGAVQNLGATTGTQVGGAATDKLGFWGKTPIVQPADTNTAGNFGDIVSALLNSGLIAGAKANWFLDQPGTGMRGGVWISAPTGGVGQAMNYDKDRIYPSSESAGLKILTQNIQKLGFWNATPVAQQTVTGSRGGNAALASLLTALALIGIVVNNSTA